MVYAPILVMKVSGYTPKNSKKRIVQNAFKKMMKSEKYYLNPVVIFFFAPSINHKKEKN